jgi:hypothetical protein
MSMKDAVDGISKDVKAALDEVAEGYDGLVAELGKEKADLSTVLEHSNKIWTHSLKAWAQLMLAPATIAAEIRNDGGAYDGS